MRRFLLASILAFAGCSPTASSTGPAPVAAESRSVIRQLGWSTTAVLPHDPTAFTQGLLWHNGALYESTGLEGQSQVRKVDLRSGQVLARWKLPPQVFGEGLAMLNGKFYNLTWQSKVGFVLDEKLQPLARFRYGNEGWGLTSDGRRLLQSDGTDSLIWRDPNSFAALDTIKVTRDGAPLHNLNELEWMQGYVWANVWQTDEIVVIDPQSGKVVAQLDMTGLLSPQTRTGREDVLNGIAYDAATGRIYLTGKNWPRLFCIQVDEIPKR